MKYRVATFRNAGLEAKWTKSHGTPAIRVRNPQATAEHQRKNWWLVDKRMWESMLKDGIVEAFTNHTLLGDVFYV